MLIGVGFVGLFLGGGLLSIFFDGDLFLLLFGFFGFDLSILEDFGILIVSGFFSFLSIG